MTSTSTAPALTLPPISALPTLSAAEMEQLLDLLFEPSPALHSLCLPILHGVTFASYDAIISHINNLLKDLANRDKNTLDEILGSHPRLGAKKVESAQSQAEQRQLNHGAEGEKEELAWLNQQYEHRFPGLRYVVFVNGRSRPEIMENMRARIARGDIEAERQEAIQAMCDIASDRARKLQKAQAMEDPIGTPYL